MSKREDPKRPSQQPRDPRPKGGQRGVTRRDNGRPSSYEKARNPDRERGMGWPFHR